MTWWLVLTSIFGTAGDVLLRPSLRALPEVTSDDRLVLARYPHVW